MARTASLSCMAGTRSFIAKLLKLLDTCGIAIHCKEPTRWMSVGLMCKNT
jgi:hypothetical protein